MQEQTSVEQDTPSPSLEEKLVATESEVVTLKDKLLRSVAELDNTRKRQRKELGDAKREGKESAFKDLLPVFDNLERAVNAGNTDALIMAEGINIVVSQFEVSLKKIGAKRIVSVGEMFNPNLHEAIQQADSDKPAGTIVQELQAGYMLGDYVVRAAMVVVAK